MRSRALISVAKTSSANFIRIAPMIQFRLSTSSPASPLFNTFPWPMPPKLRGSLSQSLSHVRDTPLPLVYYCPSCTIWRRTLSTSNASTRRTPTTTASPAITAATAATVAYTASSSSIAHSRKLHDARQCFSRSFTTAAASHPTARHVPPRLRKLYETLAQVQDVATEQVNLSRLQLALRGLESEEPLIRVAVLGLNDDVTAARKLVRLLLADPLKPREEWEDILDDYGADAARGLLIRYGETTQTIPNNLLPTISVPSSILKKGNLEILITSLGAGGLDAAQLTADTFLVPTVTIQTSHTGRHNMVRYPVHRSIVCASGVDGMLAYSGLIARTDLKKEAGSIYGAIELALAEKNDATQISFVDINKADEALAKFRESVRNASLYERGWNTSGVQPVVDWLSSSQAQAGGLNPSLKTLITSLIDAAEEGATLEQTRKLQDQEATSVSEPVRKSLDRTVSAWAERAHTELRGSLEEGFASKKWRGLAWWKLFWRVDDVGMITSEILEKNFLRRAEREVIWTAGQFQQAGLPVHVSEKVTGHNTGKQVAESSSSSDTVAVTVTNPSPKEDDEVFWPAQISSSRVRLLETTVPSLQAMAQRLVLFSLSTTGLTSALSALTYVSLPTATVYETCTMAAVGLIYSLRRQQRKWDAARAFWEEEVREDGRTALRETEQQLLAVVHEGGRVEVDTAPSAAQTAIAEARTALDEVK